VNVDSLFLYHEEHFSITNQNFNCGALIFDMQCGYKMRYIPMDRMTIILVLQTRAFRKFVKL